MTEVFNRTQGTLHVVAHAAAGLLVMRLAGELDLASTHLVDAVGAIDMHGIDTVSIDLSELEFTDSTGIQSLLRLHTDQLRAGREAVFVNPQPLIRRIFATLAIDKYLTD